MRLKHKRWICLSYAHKLPTETKKNFAAIDCFSGYFIDTLISRSAKSLFYVDCPNSFDTESDDTFRLQRSRPIAKSQEFHVKWL